MGKLRVQEICARKGMKLKDVAKRLKVSQGALSQNIAGRVSLSRLEEIAAILDVPVSEIIGEEQEIYIRKRGELVRLTPDR